jgi:hypothetical protein
MNPGQGVIAAAVGLGMVIGAVECFLGYRMFKVVVVLFGFVVGGAVSAAVGYDVSHVEAIAWVAGLVGGVIAAILLIVFYFVGVFLVGAYFGALAGALLFATAGGSPAPGVLLVIAVAAGVIALVFQKLMIVVSTAFGGALNVVAGAAFLLGVIDLASLARLTRIGPGVFEQLVRSAGSRIYALVLCWLALGIAGVIVQYRTAPPGSGHPGRPPAAWRSRRPT